MNLGGKTYREISKIGYGASSIEDFVEHCPNAVALFDREVRYISASPRWVKDFKIHLQDFRGRSHYDLFPEIPEQWKEVHRRCLAGAVESNDEEMFTLKDGTVYWISWEVRPWYTEQGLIGGIVMFSEDVTLRKKAEQETKNWSEIFQRAKWGMSVALPDNTFVKVNPAFAKMHGTTPSEWEGRSLLDMFSAEFKPKLPELAKQVNEMGELTYESIHVRKDGSEFPVLTDVAAVRDDDGQIRYRVANFLELTEQKKSVLLLERALKEVADIKFALDQSSIVATTDAKGIITYVNDKFCEISKYRREELIGKDHRIVNSGHHSKEFMSELWKTIRSGKAWSGEIKNRAKDGSYYWVATAIVPFLDDAGKPFQYTAIRTDITQKKIMEEMQANLAIRERAALEASRLKSEFLANMSHEIRTPINGVIGMLSLLSESTLTTEQSELVRSIFSSSNLLLALVNDILDLSKVEAGKLHLDHQPFKLSHLVEEMQNFFRPLAQRKGITLQCNSNALPGECFLGDVIRIRQILNNLVGNAIKFTGAGQVELVVKVDSRPDDRALIAFVIRDTGIGMDEKSLNRLFEVFMQQDASMARKYGGTGLGLAISKKLADLMKGQIKVASRPGQGSQFEFEIELPRSAEKMEVKVLRPSLRPEQRSTKKVLIVEDNPVNLHIAIHSLKGAGYQVAEARNGLESLAITGTQHFDLVLMDCQMPEMDGYEATRRLRESGYSIPIIAVTANAYQEDREQCLAAGMNDFVAKPVKSTDLLAVVDTWIASQEA